MDRKRERIINYLLILLTIAYAVFVIFYDYYRMNAYADALEQNDNEVGYAVASMIVFMCFNILCLGGSSVFLSIILFVFTRRLAKNNGKLKKKILIAILVCKIIALGLTIFGAWMALSCVYVDWVMKLVYVFVPIAYFCAILHSIVFFKKIVG